MNQRLFGALLLFAVSAAGCAARPAGTTAEAVAGGANRAGAVAPQTPHVTADRRAITLATTTSTQDSGLLDALLPRFRADSGIDVKVVAVGSGQAMELGRRGDAEVLLVHSPDAEIEFIEQGFGAVRVPLMYNDFVLVGPRHDPARVRGTSRAAEALCKIQDAGATFVSRGDRSGTHAKELSLWRTVGRKPAGSEYLQVGSGMIETLRMADEKSAYALSDRATYLAARDQVELEILVTGDESLLNHYSVISIQPARFPQLDHAAADRLIEFLQSEAARSIIAEFGRDAYGEPLFFLSH